MAAQHSFYYTVNDDDYVGDLLSEDISIYKAINTNDINPLTNNKHNLNTRWQSVTLFQI